MGFKCEMLILLKLSSSVKEVSLFGIFYSVLLLFVLSIHAKLLYNPRGGNETDRSKPQYFTRLWIIFGAKYYIYLCSLIPKKYSHVCESILGPPVNEEIVKFENDNDSDTSFIPKLSPEYPITLPIIANTALK